MMKFVIGILATYRAAQLVSIDDGPLDVFKEIRYFFGRQSHRGKVWNSLADLVHCPFCNGIWFAGLFALWLKPKSLIDWLAYVLALAGGQAFLQGFSDED